MINLNLDWENRPIKGTLTPTEHQQRLKVFEQEASQRKHEADAAEQTLITVALALKTRAR